MRTQAAILLLSLSMPVAATEIHKCRDAEDRIAYQDQPCADESLPLPPIAAPPSVPYLPISTQDDVAAAAPRSQDPVPRPAPLPLPALYRCTRENGESYVGSDPSPPPRYVPAWAVGATTTRSNLPRTPARNAYDRAVGGAYVLVHDVCRPLRRAELCAHWKSRLDSARRGAQSSFFDEREALEREAATLRESLRAHCGR